MPPPGAVTVRGRWVRAKLGGTVSVAEWLGMAGRLPAGADGGWRGDERWSAAIADHITCGGAGVVMVAREKTGSAGLVGDDGDPARAAACTAADIELRWSVSPEASDMVRVSRGGGGRAGRLLYGRNVPDPRLRADGGGNTAIVCCENQGLPN